jgi:choloylglycine hydrolase
MMNCVRKTAAIFCAACFLAGAVLLATRLQVTACSRVLSADNGQAVLVGRNMDWPTRTVIALWALPRGIQRVGLLSGNNPLTWTAKYGSLVTASYENNRGGVSDGINEKGLAANLLWLSESNYGERDEHRPGVSVMIWAQYVLDNYATVDEAVKDIKNAAYQVVEHSVPLNSSTAETTMQQASLHLSLADKSVDSAIIEYIDGKPVVYHDRNYTIMTNSPTFEKQQENLKQHQGFGGDKPVPGTTDPTDRFVRAAYYMKYLPKPQNLREAIAGIFSVLRNASQPFQGSTDAQHPFTSATIWRTVGDLTNGYYFFESTISPSIIWAAFSEFNLEEGSPAMKLDLSNNLDFSGNVSKKFVKGELSELGVPAQGPVAK